MIEQIIVKLAGSICGCTSPELQVSIDGIVGGSHSEVDLVVKCKTCGHKVKCSVNGIPFQVAVRREGA